MMLFHISEQPGIELFEPRWSKQANRNVVWAIDADHLRNYLVPRECRRVTYYAGPQTSNADIEHFLGTSPAVVAIESGWFEQLRSCHLYCYHLPPDIFECIDTCAGYFVSSDHVAPARVEVLDDLILELLKRGVELRLVPSLWPLRCGCRLDPAILVNPHAFRASQVIEIVPCPNVLFGQVKYKPRWQNTLKVLICRQNSRVCDLLNATQYESTGNYQPLNLHGVHIYLYCQYRRTCRQSF